MSILIHGVEWVNVGMHSDIYHAIWFKLWSHDRYYCTVQFDANVIDLDLDIRSQECEKGNVPIISQSYRLIWFECGILLRLLLVMKVILIWFCPFSIQGRERYLCDLKKKQNKQNFNICLYSDIYRPISFKLSMMIEITKLYIFIFTWMTLTFIHHSWFCWNLQWTVSQMTLLEMC